MSASALELNARGFIKHRQPNAVCFSTNSEPKTTRHFVTHTAQCSKFTNATWMEFTQSTSLHGLRYIWDYETFTLRRIIWLLLVLGGIGLMSFQIVDRLLYFMSFPVTVNLHVNYNKSLLFPAVTFCNQNAFRSSASAEHGRYQLINNMYTNIHNFSLDDLDRFNSSNILLDDLFLASAHKIEDMIVRCKWRGSDCDETDFTRSISERGVCFTFNSENNQHFNQLSVDSVGSDNGLSLTLNIEDYEYMPGPNDGAGIKLLVHDQKQFPKVHELGIALSVGLHSFVGLQFVSVSNLPKPHGRCKTPKLKYFDYYSPDNCQVDCYTSIVINHCGCKLHFMPHTIGSPNVCSLKQYYSCYLPQKDHFIDEMHQTCSCPVSCDFKIYDPALSYSSLSTMVQSRLLDGVNMSAMTRNYNQAREITHRLQKEYAIPFNKKLWNVKIKYEILETVVLQDLLKQLKDQRNAAISVFTEISKVGNKTKHLYHFRKYMVSKNFVRAGSAMEERSFFSVTNDMQQFVFHAKNLVNIIAFENATTKASRHSLFVFISTILRAKMFMCDNAISNYTELSEAFRRGKPIFNYVYQDKGWRERKAIIPKVLLKNAFKFSRLIRNRTARIPGELKQIKTYLQKMLDMTSEAYYNSTFNATKFHIATVQYLYWCRHFLQSKSHLLKEGSHWPITEMTKQQNKLELIMNQIRFLKNNILNALSSLENNLENVENLFLKRIKDGLDMCDHYLKDGSVRKLDIAKLFASDTIKEGSNSLTVLFNEVRTRGQIIFDYWGDLLMSSDALWKLVLSDVDMASYYKHMKMTKYLQDYDNVSESLTKEYESYRDSLDLRTIVQHVDDDFLRELKSLIAVLEDFNESENVDHNFVRSNFLLVNLYFKELNYEQITQQKAYDVFALFCDIGGSMGLFIGASVMTIFEIIDLLVNSCAVKLFTRPTVTETAV
ncbi:uncharacterized protein LOC126828235 [Patella vulgata]|uniref:uncharacterized protein LOC126828235 n=1 Tax=Patella vulgata TaxID=6465 RepID=UPI0024A92816|nr:uncharacterized protein LOC126828235 [Patella vulgata]